MQPLYGHDDAVAAWVSVRLNSIIHPPFVAIGFMRGNVLSAGAVFNDHVPGGNIEMTIASDGPLSRAMFAEIARYVFVQLKCSRLSVTTHDRNEAVKNMALRIGFKRESIRADYFGEGDHAALFRMKRRECKWLRN